MQKHLTFRKKIIILNQNKPLLVMHNFVKSYSNLEITKLQNYNKQLIN